MHPFIILPVTVSQCTRATQLEQHGTWLLDRMEFYHVSLPLHSSDSALILLRLLCLPTCNLYKSITLTSFTPLMMPHLQLMHGFRHVRQTYAVMY